MLKILKYVIKIIPSRIISTIFGLGFFKVYKNLLASLFAILITYLIVESTVTFEETEVIIGTIIFYEFVFALYFCIIFGGFYLYEYSFQAAFGNPPEETIIIDKAAGQLLVFSTTIPVIEYSYNYLFGFYTGACSDFFFCSENFLKFCSYLSVLLLIVGIFMFFNYIKMWPSNWIDAKYSKNSIGIILDDVVSALYTILLLYFISIVIFGLPIKLAISYFTELNEYLPILGEIIYNELRTYPLLRLII